MRTWLGWVEDHLAAILLCFLLLTLGWALLYLPLYTDEVGWRFQLSRFVPDGGVDRFINETCGLNTLAPPPLFMRPVRLFSSFVGTSFPDPRVIRATGVAVAVAAVLLIRTIIRRVEREPERRNLLEALTYTLLALGILPLLLTLSRPEQTILIALLLATLITLSGAVGHKGSRWSSLRAVAIATLAVIAMCYHLKTGFYVPVFLACLWVSGRSGARWVHGTAAIVIVAALVSALSYWSNRFRCPDDAILRGLLARENLSSVLMNSGSLAFAKQAPTILLNMLPVRYVSGTLPSNYFMSGWLPPLELAAPVLFGWRAVLLATWGAFLIVGAVAAWRVVQARRYSAPAALLSFVTLACLTVWAALQNQKNPYEAMLYLPLLVTSVALLLATSHTSATMLRRTLLALLPVCLVTQVGLAWALTPGLGEVQRNVGNVPGRLASYSVWSHSRFVPRVRAAARLCGLVPGVPVRRLLVDDLTYLSFVDSYRPLHVTGVVRPWNGKITDPAAYLRQMRSSGAVIGCEYLPDDMRRRAIAVGSVCCVRPD